MQRTVSRVTREVLGGRAYQPGDQPFVMAFLRNEGGRVREYPAPLGRRPALLLSLRHQYRFIHLPGDTEHGPWSVTTVAYSYELLDRSEHRLIAYHWHPDPRSDENFPSFPHLHVGRQFAHSALPEDFRPHASALVRAHPPTGRVSLESILRLAIQELGVEPLVERWESVLEETKAGG
ncbi:MAG: hypothetical protein QOF33_2997 [Thermomicrobiales bacterium]|nr:hypothetical protein [Thermomicrobiales bacterium]